jgi:hypothetical protein
MEVQYELLITGLKKAPFLKDSERKNVLTKVECKLSIMKIDSSTVLNSDFTVELDISDLSSFIDLLNMDEATVRSWVEMSSNYEEEKQKLYGRLQEVFYPTNEEVNGLDWLDNKKVLDQIKNLEQQVTLINQSIESLKQNNGITD